MWRLHLLLTGLLALTGSALGKAIDNKATPGDPDFVLFIAGGSHSDGADNGVTNVELIHSGVGFVNCEPVAQLPDNGFPWTPSFQVGGEPVVCGAEGRCMAYAGAGENAWRNISSHDVDLKGSFAAQLADGRAWLTGGYNPDLDIDFYKTWVFDPQGYVVEGPELPEPMAEHCMARIDDDRYFLAYRTAALLALHLVHQHVEHRAGHPARLSQRGVRHRQLVRQRAGVLDLGWLQRRLPLPPGDGRLQLRDL